jgi:hypothetical protein
MQERNGAKILLSLRSGSNTWEALCRELGLDPQSPEAKSDRVTLADHLIDLQKLGLIEFQGTNDTDIQGEIKISKTWISIQNVLGKPNLADLADIASSAEGVVFNPIFGRPKKPADPVDMFVLMPFTSALNPVYEQHLKKFDKKLGIIVRRADDIFSPKPFMNKIWSSIYAARIIVADCTTRNANVFYELGLAHAVGKPVVLIAQDKADVPSDISHIDFIEYQYTPEGIKDLIKRLDAILKKELKLPPRKTKKAAAKKVAAARPPDPSGA